MFPYQALEYFSMSHTSVQTFRGAGSLTVVSVTIAIQYGRGKLLSLTQMDLRKQSHFCTMLICAFFYQDGDVFIYVTAGL
jgi:hypothetical protein